MLIGYARCSTDKQDLRAQKQQLRALGIEDARIYVDHGYTGRNRERPGLKEALAATRAGDTLVVTKLDRLARSVADAAEIARELQGREARLQMGTTVYDPADPFGRMFFNLTATFAEFEADLISQRTREGLAIARERGRLRGRSSKFTPAQQRHIGGLIDGGEHTQAEIAALMGVAPSTISRFAKKWRATGNGGNPAG
ncbi:recombinase family protein [Corynebacterium sp. CCM 9204]|uniref:recombinase family protein n=1 Tax=Corynebacterium sp. CCM 9204 TaxID=3057616 RepID=UPI0035266ED0